jgi:hypothetical protein
MRKNLVVLILGIFCLGNSFAQTAVEANPKKWTVHNRAVDYDKEVIHLNGQENDGVLWLNDFTFKNGEIELDIKGKDLQGQSFVGVAFHGKDDNAFDAIYFRPFNFQNAERKSHSVQYISMPKNDWSTLRTAFPGKYENTVNPVPDPNNWFHAKIVISHPNVKVYVDGSKIPSLEIKQLSEFKNGKLGLWVGNGSEGWFKNLKITR